MLFHLNKDMMGRIIIMPLVRSVKIQYKLEGFTVAISSMVLIHKKLRGEFEGLELFQTLLNN